MGSAHFFATVGLLLGAAFASLADAGSPSGSATKIDLVFRGGHDIDPRDRGRPVVLIAAALGVPPAVFRDAFTHVRPAGSGQQPAPAQVRLNKQALLARLGPYGVTNERLDEVSNYYRYRRETGELWRHVDAAGYAFVQGGKIVSVTITRPGAGYTTAPVVSVPGVGLTVYPQAVLAFGTYLARNGSVSMIVTSPLGDNENVRLPSSYDIPEERIQDFHGPKPPPPPPPPSN